MLHAVDTQHGFKWIRAAAIACFRVNRFDNSKKFCPKKNRIHPRQEDLFTSLTALTGEFAIGKCELMFHELTCSLANWMNT